MKKMNLPSHSRNEGAMGRRGTGAMTGFSEDFSSLRGFLVTKPYVDSARSEKPRRDGKGPESIWAILFAPVPQLRCGQCWNRTSSLLGVNETLCH